MLSTPAVSSTARERASKRRRAILSITTSRAWINHILTKSAQAQSCAVCIRAMQPIIETDLNLFLTVFLAAPFALLLLNWR